MNILVNAYTAKNLGDDLFLDILFKRYTNVNFTLVTYHRDYEKIFSNYPNVTVKKRGFLYKILNKLNLVDSINNFLPLNKYSAFVVIGGSLYPQTDNWKKDLEKKKRFAKKLKKKNIKLFVLGCNFGPYSELDYVNKHKELFKIYDDICFRDEYSYSLFSEINSVRYAPDVVFNLKPIDVKKESNSVGISIMNLNNHKELARFTKEYESKMAELIDFLIKMNKKVSLFSFCEYEGDNEIMNNILNLCLNENKSKINLFNYQGNITEFINNYSSMESIIACRFHSFILAKIFKQNVYTLIYNQKTLNVLKDLNISENYYTSIDQINSLSPITVLHGIESINQFNNELIYKSKDQFRELDQVIASTMNV